MGVMVRRPYRIARQEHLGDMLDRLGELGHVAWRWDYADRRAIFHVRLRGGEWQTLDTKSAETVVQAACDRLGIRWKPVPLPGGEAQRAEVEAWIGSADEE